MPPPKSQNLRITRLRLINWRNFREVDIRLAKRVFIVGPNASGKSNLLDALRFLRELVLPGGGLQAAVNGGKRGGLSKLRCLHARKPSYVEINVDLGTDAHPETWGYRVRFAHTGKGTASLLSVIEEELRSSNEIRLSQRPDHPSDPMEWTQTQIEQVSKNQPYREIVAFFQSIRYLHIVPQIVRDLHRARLDEEDPYGGDLLRRMSDTQERVSTSRLRRISEALQIAVPQFTGLELGKDKDGHPHLYASYSHWRPNATKQGEETFSDGTLRLIGFLWSITEAGGPLLLEEPELSLHDTVIAQLPAIIARMQRSSGRQVIATTHSQALLDADGIGLHEVHRLIVDENGTRIITAVDDPAVRPLVEQGAHVGEVIVPITRPARVEQLSFLDVLAR